MSVDLNGIINWLKGWFYDKTEVTGFLNNKANVSDLQTTNSNLSSLQSTVDNKVDKVTGKGLSTEDYTTVEKSKLANIEAEANKTIVDSALSSTSTNPVQNKVINTYLHNHSHITDDVYEDNYDLDNIGVELGESQSTINLAIDTAVGSLDGRIDNLEGVEFVKVVTEKPTTPSEETMNILWVVANESSYDIWITVNNNGTYSWDKIDENILDDLSIDWSDILNNPFSSSTPSSFANASHTHSISNITNLSTTLNGKAPTDHSSTATTYGVGTSTEYGHNKIIDNLTASTLVNGESLSAHQGYILNRNINSTYDYINEQLSYKQDIGDYITSIELVPKSSDSTGAIRLYYGDEPTNNS